MNLAIEETQRGWGGPVALLVFVLAASLFWWVMETYGPAAREREAQLMIDNPSPTEEWEDEDPDYPQVTAPRGVDDGDCGGGVVDHGSWRSGRECVCGRCDMTPRHALP